MNEKTCVNLGENLRHFNPQIMNTINIKSTISKQNGSQRNLVHHRGKLLAQVLSKIFWKTKHVENSRSIGTNKRSGEATEAHLTKRYAQGAENWNPKSITLYDFTWWFNSVVRWLLEHECNKQHYDENPLVATDGKPGTVFGLDIATMLSSSAFVHNIACITSFVSAKGNLTWMKQSV